MTALDDAIRAKAEAEAAFEISLGNLHARLDKQETDRRERDQRRSSLLRMVVPVPITAPQIILAAGAGTLTNMPDTLGPHDGYAWFVNQLTCMSFSAGTVSVYRNFIQDENFLVSFTQAGTFFFGSTQLYLGDSDMLAFSASGITGNVTISGWAINVPTPLVPEYIL